MDESSSSFLPAAPFYQFSTLVADQLHGRGYRVAMTRKWNVLSRAVIHLFHLTSPHATATKIAISGYRPEVSSVLKRYIRGIYNLAANRPRYELWLSL